MSAEVAGDQADRLRLTHVLHDAIELRHGDRPLLRYVYEPRTDPTDSPKPYFHPLWTLAGNVVTLFRPHDHVWHRGMAMTMAQLSGQNFWGGPTYVHGQGYVWREDHGRIRHRAWDEIRCDAGAVLLRERLEWISHEGETWIAEDRRIEVGDLDAARGYWALDLAFRLRNVRGQPLVFGSPTTAGRPQAGYGGLSWRGVRSFLHGTILAGGGLEGPEVMGKPAPWLAYIGLHDGTAEQSTLLFLDQPGNPRFPNKWFIRNDPYPLASCAFMFDEEYLLEPAAELALSYRVVLANGAWDRARIEGYIQRQPFSPR